MLRLHPRAVCPFGRCVLQPGTASPRAVRHIRPTVHNSSRSLTNCRSLSDHHTPSNNTPPPNDSDLTPLPLATHTTHIKRSYPSAKPTKLLTGLTALLSPGRNWQLSPTHDAIHLATTLSTASALTNLIETITHEAETLSHHPHISHQQLDGRWVCVVTCTTHVPHGLSLKDVRLAERVDAVVERVGATVVRSEDVAVAEVVERLVRRNEELAGRARADPGSVCAKSR